MISMINCYSLYFWYITYIKIYGTIIPIYNVQLWTVHRLTEIEPSFYVQLKFQSFVWQTWDWVHVAGVILIPGNIIICSIQHDSWIQSNFNLFLFFIQRVITLCLKWRVFNWQVLPVMAYRSETEKRNWEVKEIDTLLLKITTMTWKAGLERDKRTEKNRCPKKGRPY